MLEIRGFDQEHVYLRVRWYYAPEELPRGREDYHGSEELISSNDMSIVSGSSVVDHADIPEWNEAAEDEPPKPCAPYWRQRFDKTTGRLSVSKFTSPFSCFAANPTPLRPGTSNLVHMFRSAESGRATNSLHRPGLFRPYASTLHPRGVRGGPVRAQLPRKRTCRPLPARHHVQRPTRQRRGSAQLPRRHRPSQARNHRQPEHAAGRVGTGNRVLAVRRISRIMATFSPTTEARRGTYGNRKSCACSGTNSFLHRQPKHIVRHGGTGNRMLAVRRTFLLFFPSDNFSWYKELRILDARFSCFFNPLAGRNLVFAQTSPIFSSFFYPA